ncbi:MAG: hypothetical protein JWN34_6191 [Bryobacterales bacterium]|nr:hypothetical protein [Bryobacterales bacterium]
MIMEPRPTGISAVGDMPWGTHFCHFYETKEDQVNILMPFFRAGLEANEFCMMVDLDEEDAVETFRRNVPNADKYLADGDMEIVPYSRWYLPQGTFDLKQVIKGWQDKLEAALKKGYAGIRINGNEAWLNDQDWSAFADYEHKLNQLIVDRQMIVMCTYPLRAATARNLFDVARTHQFLIALNNGRWEVFETPDLRQAREDLRRLNAELEVRVTERTAELAAANSELALVNKALTAEVAERRETERKLQESERQLRALSARVQSAREEEGTRIARELHDELGSALTSLKWEMEGLQKEFDTWTDSSRKEALRSKTQAMLKLTDAMIESVRRIASDLRPSILDDLGLVEAIEWLGEQFQERTGIVCRSSYHGGTVNLSTEESTATFRIVQETLTNIVRHAHATEVDVTLHQAPSGLTLTIKDNGVGFVESNTQQDRLSLGLLGMRERSLAVGGSVEIETAEGKGTTITLRIPAGGAQK